MLSAPFPSGLSALRAAARWTAKFFEAQPFAYEETLDHLLLHNLEIAMTMSPLGSRVSTRFVGGKGQIYLPGHSQAIEAADLVFYLKGSSAPPKALLLQSKRLFPKRPKRQPLKPTGSLLRDIEQFIHLELAAGPYAFGAASHYQSLSVAPSNKQWNAISTINGLSQAAYGRDAIQYLLYNPLNSSAISSAAPFSGGLGLRILFGSVIKARVPNGGPVYPAMLSSEFAKPGTEFARFVADAISCNAGIPFGEGLSGFELLLPSQTRHRDLGPMPPGRVERRAATRIGLQRLADERNRPIVDISSCPSIVLHLENDVVLSEPDDGLVV